MSLSINSLSIKGNFSNDTYLQGNIKLLNDWRKVNNTVVYSVLVEDNNFNEMGMATLQGLLDISCTVNNTVYDLHNFKDPFFRSFR